MIEDQQNKTKYQKSVKYINILTIVFGLIFLLWMFFVFFLDPDEGLVVNSLLLKSFLSKLRAESVINFISNMEAILFFVSFPTLVILLFLKSRLKKKFNYKGSDNSDLKLKKIVETIRLKTNQEVVMENTGKQLLYNVLIPVLVLAVGGITIGLLSNYYGEGISIIGTVILVPVVYYLSRKRFYKK